MSYIDRELLLIGVDGCISALHVQAKGDLVQEGAIKLVEATRDYIASLSTADVVEVRCGRWIPSESDFDDDDTLFDVEDWCDWQCSVCREDICYEDPMERRFLPKFCPNCGAKMDGGAHETD